MTIAVDFDGTIIEPHKYPRIGKALPYAFDVLKALQERGHKLILWTCRDGFALQVALDFCEENGLIFDAVNDNLVQGQYDHCSRKIVADVYIDDMAWPQEPIDWLNIGRSFGLNC